MPATHEFIDHTSEVTLRLTASSQHELLAEAGRALGSLMLRGEEVRAGGAWRSVEVSSSDSAALLVDWLNELIFLAETEWWIGTEFDVGECSDKHLKALVRGVAVEETPGFVKAATMHALRFEEDRAALLAEVTLDV